MTELLQFFCSRDWFVKSVLWTFLVLGQMVSLIYLDKYPIPTSDDTTYAAPSWSLLTEHKIACITVPPMGNFRESSLVQHGRLPTFIRAIFFKLFGCSLFIARLPSFLYGLVILYLVYILSLKMFEKNL